MNENYNAQGKNVQSADMVPFHSCTVTVLTCVAWELILPRFVHASHLSEFMFASPNVSLHLDSYLLNV